MNKVSFTHAKTYALHWTFTTLPCVGVFWHVIFYLNSTHVSFTLFYLRQYRVFRVIILLPWFVDLSFGKIKLTQNKYDVDKQLLRMGSETIGMEGWRVKEGERRLILCLLYALVYICPTFPYQRFIWVIIQNKGTRYCNPFEYLYGDTIVQLKIWFVQLATLVICLSYWRYVQNHLHFLDKLIKNDRAMYHRFSWTLLYGFNSVFLSL